jgi:peptide/nickel transport system substrate-binding protein
MKRREFTVALAAGALIGRAGLAKADTPAMQEVPSLMEKVKSGALPPVGKRIPEKPSIVETFYGGEGPGRNGGACNMLIASARDTRLMTLYANARLIVYDDKLELHPDILESYEAKDGREFTFKIRAGHKWSDGHPFTTEDSSLLLAMSSQK